MLTNRKASGFTLLEALVMVSILALLVSVGVPAMKETLQNNKTVAQANDLVAAINLARSTAVTQRTPVSVCSSSSGTACTNDADWAVGFIVINSGAVVKVFDSYDGGATLQEAANTKALTFDSYGETGSSYSFTLTPGDCSDASSGKRTIEIGTTGRVSTSKLSCA